MSDFGWLDMVGVADGIKTGRFSAQEVTTWSLARMETIGRQFNAVFRIDSEAALARAHALDEAQARGQPCGPLHGVPFAHKDLFLVQGCESHMGSRVLSGRIADRTAFALECLEGAGQVNLGSLHMSEFALSPTGYNGHYGSGQNPWDSRYVCGGSSSGSGIAVAARVVFGSLGTDTAGSIRLPAAMCGVTGLKPTYRRVSVEGTLPLSSSLDCVGPIAQTARDCARMLTLISRSNPADDLCTTVSNEDYETALDGRLKGMRIGVPHAIFNGLDDEIGICLDASLKAFEARGAAIVSAPMPDMERINALAQVVLSSEAASLHRRWIESRPDDYSLQVRSRVETGYSYSAVRYIEALSARRKIVDDVLHTTFANCHLLFLPSLPVPTPTIGETTEGELEAVLAGVARIGHVTRGINYLGLPAISIPAGFSRRGLPLSLQLVGRPFAEATLLKAADAFQRETDWHAAMPPLAEGRDRCI